MDEIELYISAGEVEKVSARDGYRRCSYVALRKSGDVEQFFWGVGRLKDMTALYASAIDEALSDLVEEQLEGNLTAQVTVIVRHPNFWERLDQASIRETHHPKRQADNRDAWKRAAVVRALLEIEPARPPTGSNEEALLRRTEACRDGLKALALKVPSDSGDLWRQGVSSTGSIDEAGL